MTKADAIRLAQNSYAQAPGPCEGVVDILLALGLLKVEEPKTERERLRNVLEEFSVFGNHALRDPDVIYAALARAGIKIEGARPVEPGGYTPIPPRP